MKYIYAELRDIWNKNYTYSDYIDAYLSYDVNKEIPKNSIYDCDNYLLFDVNNFVLVASEE